MAETHATPIPTLDPSDVPAFLTAVISAPGIAGVQGLPCILWGAPGISKSATVRDIARAAGYNVVTLLLATYEPPDVLGWMVPEPAKEGRPARLHRCPPAWAVEADEAYRSRPQGRTLIFLDEISCAPPSLQAAGLRLVQERVVGDLQLPHCPILAAANPEEMAAGGFSLPPPAANRVLHVNYPLDIDGWLDWMAKGARVDGKGLLGWSEPRWQASWVRSIGLVTSFIRTRQDHLLALPKDEAGRGGPWASPRSWEMAARALAAVDTVGGSTRLRTVAIAAAVGTGIAQELLAFVNAMDLPTPEELVKEPKKLPRAQDHAYAALSSLTAWSLAVEGPARVSRYNSALPVLIHAASVVPDIACSTVQRLGTADKATWMKTDEKLLRRLMEEGAIKDIRDVLQGRVK